MNLLDIREVRDLISSNNQIDFDTSFNLARRCSQLISNPETENDGREIVIRMLDAINRGRLKNETLQIWNQLIDSAGLYTYIDSSQLKGGSLFRYETHKSKFLKNVYFHEEQLKLSVALENSESLIVSAPTSFGKSLLIEEVIASSKYKNIVVIQPTLALLDETRNKLKKYHSKYQIIISTNQKVVADKNIFLLTAERLVEFKNLPKIDFFIIDEFYKLSIERNDDRAAILNLAFYKLNKMTDKFYLLGPSIRSIPEGLEKKLNARWYKSDFATVAVDIKEIGPVPKKEKEGVLFKLLHDLQTPTLIYCSSPDKANQLVKRFFDYLNNNPIKQEFNYLEENKSLREWISKNIHPNWVLNVSLAKGVAFHHGALPRHLGSSIVEQFNKKHIKYLFCTSTLIEGVNTSAKNVILFDQTKNRKPIDYFDYKNIVGRSGRMKQHFVGNVYQFEPPPAQIELDVDIPAVTQKAAPLELLVQMKKEDLYKSTLDKLKGFEGLSEELRNVIRKNSGISVDGQVNLYKDIKENAGNYHKLMEWTNFPTYDELEKVISLGWKYLKGSESSAGVRSSKQLAYMTKDYSMNKSGAKIIEKSINSDFMRNKYPERDERTEVAIYTFLHTARHWFEYKLPKWLIAISEIQNLVFKELGLRPGNYNYFAGLIENNFLPENLGILAEYGVPISAIRKIEGLIGNDVPSDKVLETVRALNFKKLGLLDYEEQKINSIWD